MLQCGVKVTKSFLLTFSLVNAGNWVIRDKEPASMEADRDQITKLIYAAEQGDIVYTAKDCPAFTQQTNDVIAINSTDSYNITQLGSLQNINYEL